MREIKFRGKGLDNGEWAYGDLVKENRKHVIKQYEVIEYYIYSINFENGEPAIGYRAKVDPETVGEYTGLKDINGAEIYEGDIVKIQINDWSTGKILVLANEVVEFKNGKFGFKWGHRREFATFDSFTNTTFEVIGNICENSDLLGGDIA